jgi:hypothetical protein
MAEERPGRRLPSGLRAALVVLLLAWLVALVVLSRLHRGGGPQEGEGVLPVYPGAYQADIRTIPDRDWKSASYTVALDYPSLAVFNYYDEHMKSQGWSRRFPPGEPQWTVAQTGKGKHATMFSAWVSSDGLWRVDLQLTWDEAKRGAEESEAARMQVAATMSRNMVPEPAKEEKAQEKEASPFAK